VPVDSSTEVHEETIKSKNQTNNESNELALRTFERVVDESSIIKSLYYLKLENP